MRNRVVVEPPTVYPYKYRTLATSSWQNKTWSSPGSSAACVDEVHLAPYDTEVDNGGPLQIIKSEYASSVTNVTTPNYEGPVGLGSPSGSFTPFVIGSVVPNSALIAKGATAIARCEPTSPVFDASTFIGELRFGGVPKAPGIEAIHSLKERARVAKAAGSEYLNVEFGWVPLVSDLKKLHYAAHESERIMKAYRKSSGHKIRSSYEFPDNFQSKSYTGAFYPSNTDLPGKYFQGIASSQLQERTWFKGAFKYWLPTNDDQMNKFSYYRSEASKLYGVSLTPETLWNLAPWSWAVDWFTNTGDVLHNISAMGRDGLVMQYGYIMASRKVINSAAGTLPGYGSASRTQTDQIMQRYRGSPYGFGVNFSSLSTKQVAILAALGLSR